MKINEVRELSTSELKEKLYSLKEQLFELRRKKAVGALERGEDVITVRKDIARVNLVLRERELAENKYEDCLDGKKNRSENRHSRRRCL